MANSMFLGKTRLLREGVIAWVDLQMLEVDDRDGCISCHRLVASLFGVSLASC